MELKDLRIYDAAMEIGVRIWKIAARWDYFEKKTVGSQLVRSADSIAANIAEGYGRYHFKEAKTFYYYARGSLFETKTWIQKAHQRQLIDDEEYNELNESLNSLGIKLNNFINSIGK